MNARLISLPIFLALAAGAPTAASACVGDCSGGNVVTVDEILTASSIALGERALAACPAADGGSDGRVTVDDILRAIENALIGCPNEPGIVSLVNRHSGKCLEVAGASDLPGANVEQGTCRSAPHQQWTFAAAGDDHFIVNEGSGLCLEVAGGSTRDLANIRQNVCDDVPHQRWQIVRGFDLYLISSKASARCLDVAGSSVADGGNVIQFECRGTNNQLWILPEEALRLAR